MKITLEWLYEVGACASGLRWFEEYYKNSPNPTLEEFIAAILDDFCKVKGQGPLSARASVAWLLDAVIHDLRFDKEKYEKFENYIWIYPSGIYYAAFYNASSHWYEYVLGSSEKMAYEKALYKYFEARGKQMAEVKSA